MPSPHPLTERYLQMRKERRADRWLSFMVGIVLGVAIFGALMALANGTRLPPSAPEFAITILSEGIDI